MIGSRKAERALEAAQNVRGQVPDADVEGLGNDAATAAAEIVILSVPFEHTASTVKTIKASLRAGQVLVSMAVGRPGCLECEIGMTSPWLLRDHGSPRSVKQRSKRRGWIPTRLGIAVVRCAA